MKSNRNSEGECPISTELAYAPLIRSSGSLKCSYSSWIDGRGCCGGGLGSGAGGPNRSVYFARLSRKLATNWNITAGGSTTLAAIDGGRERPWRKSSTNSFGLSSTMTPVVITPRATRSGTRALTGEWAICWLYAPAGAGPPPPAPAPPGAPPAAPPTGVPLRSPWGRGWPERSSRGSSPGGGLGFGSFKSSIVRPLPALGPGDRQAAPWRVILYRRRRGKEGN